MRLKFGRLGFICLALLICLAGTGVGYAAWTDTLSIEGTITTGTWDTGGTIGFWRNWNKHNYTQGQIEGWLTSINATSSWLVPDVAAPSGTIDVKDMEVVINSASGPDKQKQFLGHYLATRLDVEPTPPRLTLGIVHNITHVPVEKKDGDIQYIDASPYFGYDFNTLEQIILTIESKYTENPTPDQFEIMKNVCDALNNLEI